MQMKVCKAWGGNNSTNIDQEDLEEEFIRNVITVRVSRDPYVEMGFRDGRTHSLVESEAYLIDMIYGRRQIITFG